ncbi:hypothetical protein [Acidibrevibacterium fodinaquatile]|uniref:hypothetical protein n=1 Tax=Acidibrevibacterium fodinaquatile TaxID=1969806 RepID=UPI000E0D25F5|nr:hypothetical protein [Acidibrevibacterium fodinaquatile]
MAESDPNAEAALARLEAALTRVAALAAQNNNPALAAQNNTAAPQAPATAHPASAALAAGLDQLIARLRSVLAETGG